MSESDGVVISVDGDMALIQVTPVASSCGKCGDKGGCGKSQAAPSRYTVRNRIGARPGDAVIVAVPEGAVLKAAMLAYLLPLLFVFVGAAIGSAWDSEGIATVAGAAIGLAGGLILPRILNAYFGSGREPWLSLRLKGQVISFDKEA